MRIKRKKLIRLIENYLLEQAEEETEPSDEEVDEEEVDEEEEPDDEEESEEEEEEDDEEESEEEEEEEAAEEPKEDSIATSKVILNSLKKVNDFIKNEKPFSALQAVNDAVKNALNGVEVKAKDLPDEIKKLLGFEGKPDEEIVNLSSAANNSGRLRIAAAKESKNK